MFSLLTCHRILDIRGATWVRRVVVGVAAVESAKCMKLKRIAIENGNGVNRYCPFGGRQLVMAAKG